jgi:iron complex transport system substrate-binding protein
MIGHRRLLSLSPNVSMILFALGADAMVVGRTQHCPESIRSYLDARGLPEASFAARLDHWEALPDVGAWPDADLARATALRPDIVLSSGTGALGGPGAEAFGLAPEACSAFDPRTFDDVDRHIAIIGDLVGEPDAARAIVADLAARRAAVLARHAVPARRPTVLFEYCVCIKYHPDPARRFANPGRFVMVGGHLAPELIRLAGGEPLFTKPGDTIAWTDFRDIRAAQPDIVLAFDCGGCPNALRHPVPARKGWSDLTAVATDSVYRPARNIANPNLCYPRALADLAEVVAAWTATHGQG